MPSVNAYTNQDEYKLDRVSGKHDPLHILLKFEREAHLRLYPDDWEQEVNPNLREQLFIRRYIANQINAAAPERLPIVHKRKN